MDHHATPRILLAEDDPVSSAFLVEALRGAGFEVHAAGDGPATLKAARAQRFDALLLDHHLPGTDGDMVLRAVRADAGAASRAALAIATTAEPDPAVHAQLCEAGFARVLLKPLNGASLREILRELGIACTHSRPDRQSALDDEAGLRASGSTQALVALRGLFAQELDVLANEWSSLQQDALSERLHRLRAACGFCGAGALQSAAENLSNALGLNNATRIAESRAEFERALAATREALELL
ncbi:MAG TPA: response regulator [Rhodanobacteraceae bacterium]|jgi:CheY-like chemotaxis protein|nr:response regulator [Rhodanobacteraceae bacterium]